jgi:hypothetical protein
LLKALFGELKIFLGETYNVRLDTDNVWALFPSGKHHF